MRVTHDSKVLDALRAGPQTAAALYELGCIAHSRVASLRQKGYVIECRRVPGVKRSSIAYEYTLVGSPLGEATRKPVEAPLASGIDGRVASSSGGGPPWGAASVATPPLDSQLSVFG